MLKSGFGWLAGLFWLVSCGSTTGTPGQGGAGSATNDAGASATGASNAGGSASALPDVDASTAIGFCQGYYAIVADLFARCWGIPAADAQALLSDPRLCDTFAASVSEGRISFDAKPAKACLSELGSAVSCAGPTDATAVVDCTVVKPLVPTGGTCTIFSAIAVGSECMDDGFCQETAAYSCQGVCAARAPDGTACDPLTGDVRCARGSTCDATSKTCVARPADVDLGGACGSALGNCKDGLLCERASGSASGVCRAQQSSGPCTASLACASPTICAGAEGSKSCTAAKADGESCTPGFRECNIVSHCGEDHQCSSMGVALGEPCGSLQGESIPCTPDAYCEGPIGGSGTCQTKKQAGEACTGMVSSECGGNRGHCDAATLLCVACP